MIHVYLEPKLIIAEALSHAFMVWIGKGSHFAITVAYTLYLPQDCQLYRICNGLTIKVSCAMCGYRYTVPPSGISNANDSLAITNKRKITKMFLQPESYNCTLCKNVTLHIVAN